MHSHTTFSDGKIAPEVPKRLHKKKRYSTLAYTDHEIMLLHTELCDKEFLPIIGIEIAIDDDRWSLYTKNLPFKYIFPPRSKCCILTMRRLRRRDAILGLGLRQPTKNGCHAVTRAYFLDEFGLI